MGNNLRFIDENQIDADATFVFTSASTALAKYLYDNDRTTQLTSSGSNDATPEVFTITFTSAKTMDRIFVDNHNIKSGTLKYWNGAAYVDFSSAIAWSASATTSNFYEFNSVSTLRLQLTMNTTIVVNAEKVVGQLRGFAELGEVATNPSDFPVSFPEASVMHSTSKGGNVYVFFGSKFRTAMTFSDASDADVTLFETLKNLGTPFYVYPNGGQTTLTNRAFRTQDMYFVNYTNPFQPELKAGLLGINTVIEVILEET
jgi:hypothetical protein